MIILQSDNTLQISTPAKINLFLEVLGKRPDGYHEIDTLMHPVTLFDSLTFTPAHRADVTLTCDAPGIPLDKSNTVLKAAEAFQRKTGRSLSLAVYLQKNIPSGAGLGGGSSDAAATLVGLNLLHGSPLDTVELEALAAEVGSDAAFFVRCQTARCTGRGEQVRPLHFPCRLELLLAVPRLHVSTRVIYSEMKFLLTNPEPHVKFPVWSSYSALSKELPFRIYNRLESAALEKYPELMAFKNRLERSTGFPFHLTGSGGAFYSVVPDAATSDTWAERLRNDSDGKFYPVRSYISTAK